MAASLSIDPELLRLAGELGREGFLSLSEEEQEKLLKPLAGPAHDIIEARCKDDVLYWLQNHTATENPQYEKHNLPFRSPFPKKDYFVPLFKAFATHRRLFIPKTRDMMTSFSIMGFSMHRAQWFKEETIVQADSEDKAAELLDYGRQFYFNQPLWLQQRHPLKNKSIFAIDWEDGGRLRTIPKGADKIRMFHPTRAVLDEASFLTEAQDCYDAAHPVCDWIVAISSAGPGWFGNQCQRGTE